MARRPLPGREGAIARLTLVSDRFDEDRGGREGYLGALARFASEAGHETTCVTARPGERLARREGPVLAAVPVEGATHYQLHSGLYREAFEAERESLSSFLRRALYRPANRVNRFRSALLSAERRLLRSDPGPKLMVFSEGLRARLEAHVGATGRICLERPGADLDRFRPGCAAAPRPPEETTALRLLFVAHNFELKGLRPLIAALARARRAGLAVRLSVAGRGHAGPFRRLAERAGVADGVAFVGAVSQAAMPALYRAHDALVHPTFYDPFSLVALEALASGLPVVTTRHNGASEILTPDEDGFLLEDPRDSEGLVRAFTALSDPAQRSRLSDRAASRGRLFSRRRHFERTLAWLGLTIDSTGVGPYTAETPQPKEIE